MAAVAAVAPDPRGPKRLLVIRFSSFGDIVQAASVPGAFRRRFPGAEVDWLVREDFKSLLTAHPDLRTVITLPRRAHLFSLIRLAWRLSGNGYTHVYDAHSNLRSAIVRGVFHVRRMLLRLAAQPSPALVRRPKERIKRWLFFRWRLKVLPQPYRGAESFLRPLRAWGVEARVPDKPQFKVEATVPAAIIDKLARLPRPLIAAAPSAAWEMKRWPIDHWQKLMRELPDCGFVFLGGPEDLFINELCLLEPLRTLNVAGPLSLEQSCELLKSANLVIANDTGLLHVADQMERPTVALIGPTAFGYPSHRTSVTAEIELWCKPCSKDGRGGCKNDVYKRCLVELTPELVAAKARARLGADGATT